MTSLATLGGLATLSNGYGLAGSGAPAGQLGPLDRCSIPWLATGMPDADVVIPGTSIRWSSSAAYAELDLGTATIRFSGSDGRLTVRLQLAVGPAIDISAQPALVWELATDAALSQDRHPEQLIAALRRRLVEVATAWRLRVPVRPDLEPAALLTGLSFPLLVPSVEAGASPARKIPQWSLPVLRHSEPAAAARLAFGALANRRVCTAVSHALIGAPSSREPGAPLPLTHLGVALMGSTTLDPDRLASVLEHPGAPWPEQRWPTVEEVRAAQRRLSPLGATRVQRVLTDALALPEGWRMLRDTVQMLGAVATMLPPRPPHGLVELHRTCVELLPADPNPNLRPAQPQPATSTSAGPAPPALAGRTPTPVPAERSAEPPPAETPRAAYGPPRLRRRGTPARTTAGAVAFSYAPAIRSLHNHELLADHTLVLPRTSAELHNWSRILSNCLDDFVDAVASGVSVIIGVRAAGRLSAAAEIRHGRILVQFLGPRNRPVSRLVAATLTDLLVERGLIDERAPGNRQWLELTGATDATHSARSASHTNRV